MTEAGITRQEVDDWLHDRNQVRVPHEFAETALEVFADYRRLTSAPVLMEVADERRAQDEEWGEQTIRDHQNTLAVP